MSAQMMSAALRMPGLSLSERVIYASLCDRANGDMVCWPQIDTLAKDHEMSRRGVIAAITELRRRELIRVENRYKQSSYYYILPLKSAPRPQSANGANNAPETDASPSWDLDRFGANNAPEDSGANNAPEPGVQKTTSEVQNPAFSGAKNRTSEVQNLHPESPIESPKESPTESPISRVSARVTTLPIPLSPDPEGWAEWIAAYPASRQMKPRMARLAYQQALAEGAKPEQLLTALRNYRFLPGQWTIHPENWLRNGCWDVPDTEPVDPVLQAAGVKTERPAPSASSRERQPFRVIEGVRA